MTTTTYSFENTASFSYDDTKIQFVNNVASLKQVAEDEDYTQSFDSDTGFTYDNAKAEFTGGLVRQKDLKPANVIATATFTSGKDLNFISSGSLTGTYIGTPTITNGELVCTGDVYKGVYWASSAIGDLASVFSIKFNYTPNYSGVPANVTSMASVLAPSGNTDKIQVFHSNSSGYIRFNIYNSSGTSVGIGVGVGTVWSPTAGTKYEVEICVNTVAGTINVFIDGVKKDGSFTGFTRGTSATRLHIGTDTAYFNANATFDNVIMYNDVQHTANYTPGYTPLENRYAESVVVLPEMHHDGAGSIIDFNSLTTTETGSPRYTVQLAQSGVDLYHNGSAYVASNGTYAQASTVATFNTYAAALDVAGETYKQFKVYFPDSATQSSVSELVANVTEDGIFDTSNPTIHFNTAFRCTDVSAISKVSSVDGANLVKVVLNRNGVDYYYDTVNEIVATSDGYAKSNTFAELTEAILDTFTNGNRYEIYLKLYLHSEDGSATPTLTSYSATYDFALSDPVLPNVVSVEGFIFGRAAPSDGREIYVRPYAKGYFNEGIFIEYDWQLLATADEDGYFYGDCFLQKTGEFWDMKIGKQRYKVELQDVTDMDLKNAPTFSLIAED